MMDPRTGLSWLYEGIDGSVGQFSFRGMAPRFASRYILPIQPPSARNPPSARANAFQSSVRPSLQQDQYILVLPGMPLFVAVPPARTDRVGVIIANTYKIYDGSWIALASTAHNSFKMIPHGGDEVSTGWQKVPFDATPLLTSARNQTVNIPEPFILRLPGLGAIPISP